MLVLYKLGSHRLDAVNAQLMLDAILAVSVVP